MNKIWGDHLCFANLLRSLTAAYCQYGWEDFPSFFGRSMSFLDSYILHVSPLCISGAQDEVVWSLQQACDAVSAWKP